MSRLDDLKELLVFQEENLTRDARIIDLENQSRENVAGILNTMERVADFTPEERKIIKDINNVRRVRMANYLRLVLEEFTADLY